jgi:hypothetical protein
LMGKGTEVKAAQAAEERSSQARVRVMSRMVPPAGFCACGNEHNNLLS